MIFRLLFPLLIISVLLCAAVPALGKRAYTDDPSWSAFGFDACALPCWAGITPGQTSFSQSYDLLVRYVPALNTRLLMSGSQINFAANMSDYYANGLLFYHQGSVGNIRLNVRLPLAQLSEQLGIPHCAIYNPGPYGTPGSITVYWEVGDSLIAALLGNPTNVSPTATINAISMSANESACDHEDTIAWLGFAPRWRYARENGL